MRMLALLLSLALLAFTPPPLARGQVPREVKAPHGDPLLVLELDGTGLPRLAIPFAAIGCYFDDVTLALATFKDQPAVYFGFGKYSSGVGRWQLPKPGADGQPVLQKRFTQLTLEEGAEISPLVPSQSGARFLVRYTGGVLIYGSVAGPIPPPADPFFQVWDTEAGKVVLSLKPKGKNICPFATLSADGKTLLITAYENPDEENWRKLRPVMQFWDIDSGKLMGSLPAYGGPLALSPDGRTVAAKFSLVERATGQVRATLSQPEPDPEYKERSWSTKELRFAPNGRYVAGRDWNGWVVWDVEGNIVLGKDPDKRPTAFCFHPKEGWTTGRRDMKQIAYSPDGKFFAASILKETKNRDNITINREPSIRVWQVGK